MNLKWSFNFVDSLVTFNRLICILAVTFIYTQIWIYIYIHTSWPGVFLCIPTDKVDFSLLPNDVSVDTKIKADKITEIWLWAVYWLWTNLCYLNRKRYLRIICACACVCVRADIRTVCMYVRMKVSNKLYRGSETIQWISMAFGVGDLYQHLLSVFYCSLYWLTQPQIYMKLKFNITHFLKLLIV